MSTSRERTRHASRSRARRGPTPDHRRRPGAAAYDDAYLDGLFTYCLSVMCEHDSAIAALGEALAVAERLHGHGRRPADPDLHRAWLYALARWSCLRRLAVQRERDGHTPVVPRVAGEDAEERRRELAALAWPEAAGTVPEQREALELAVRHQLAPAEVGRVLRVPADQARTLLTSGACEVERARGALAAVEAGGCPVVRVLAGQDRLLMAPGLRRELVRHVDECPVCRRSAQRAMAGTGWPGTAPAGAERLAVLPAPRQAVHAARVASARARAQHAPKVDRAGFPLDERDRAARREKLRSRAVTTTVVATVLAAPALALWAAYRGAPVTGESSGAAPAATDDDRSGEEYEYPYENAGRAGDPGRAEHEQPGGGSGPRPESGRDGDDPDEQDGPDGDDADGASSPSPSDDSSAGPGRITVEAVATSSGTRITLTASGGSPVDWRVSTDAGWLRLSQSSGTLKPGERVTLLVWVDRDREPSGAWQGRVTVAPSGAVVTIEGHGPVSPGPGPGDPEPSEPEPSEPDPEPSEPEPDPDPSDPEPSEPEPGANRAH
ncbi:BACON domain-containing protein [Streptomyces otsuchiensis]|uniref:BACON domain-containing protein n=1 Tax=Streptomyces otsuchiensis TaxID=2681388 RepID=UPI001300AC7E|nr:hypothetical protein [Streptomyces otsuchiensis]